MNLYLPALSGSRWPIGMRERPLLGCSRSSSLVRGVLPDSDGSASNGRGERFFNQGDLEAKLVSSSSSDIVDNGLSLRLLSRGVFSGEELRER